MNRTQQGGREAQRPRLVYMTDDLIQRIDDAAARQGDPNRSAFVRRALTEHLRRLEADR